VSFYSIHRYKVREGSIYSWLLLELSRLFIFCNYYISLIQPLNILYYIFEEKYFILYLTNKYIFLYYFNDHTNQKLQKLIVCNFRICSQYFIFYLYCFRGF